MNSQLLKKRVEKEKLKFLTNQYSKFQNQDISGLGYIKMVGYRFSSKPNIVLLNLTKLLLYLHTGKNLHLVLLID